MLGIIAQSPLSVSFCLQSRVPSKPIPSTRCLQRSLARFTTQASDSGLRYRFPRKTEPPVKLGSPPTLSPHRQLTQRSISPQIYREQYSAWRELSSVQSHKDGRRGLQRNSLLRVVSWNIDFASPGPTERVATAMEYLQTTFGDDPGQLAIVLQEVCQRSVQQILQTRWVQQNFIIAGHEPPRTFQAGIPRPARYFTLVMTPKSLRLESSFRMPLPSEMGRDALFVDVQLCPTNQRPNSEMKDVLRLCTTHLESLEEGTSLRTRQLELISQKLN
ncbi:hypothetical protein K469DRAFT_697326 [Zopfia rhizophila CBS 207.26]|uniref:Endonuclease/exonuclease/phosphatase domain-containing protein n=1 Tax=Zopfia rhizophila CBS 207.26 TaxID=1314779 RepID=A0A6A6DD00_9PEZI|nr:hypothetical protein K469DRAFT_697326 [Zopfia rhizophila CBS 207.26]